MKHSIREVKLSFCLFFFLNEVQIAALRSLLMSFCVVLICLAAMEFHERLQSLAAKEGLKGRKVTRALESFSWNITILKVSTHTRNSRLGRPSRRVSPPARTFFFFLLFSIPLLLWARFSFLPCVTSLPASLPGSGRPAEAHQSRGAGEHEAGPRRGSDREPHQGGRGREEGPLADAARSRRRSQRRLDSGVGGREARGQTAVVALTL